MTRVLMRAAALAALAILITAGATSARLGHGGCSRQRWCSRDSYGAGQLLRTMAGQCEESLWRR